jgi:hypothetical protein
MTETDGFLNTLQGMCQPEINGKWGNQWAISGNYVFWRRFLQDEKGELLNSGNSSPSFPLLLGREGGWLTHPFSFQEKGPEDEFPRL